MAYPSRNTGTYSTPNITTPYLAQENGDLLLQENGDFLFIEQMLNDFALTSRGGGTYNTVTRN